MKFFYSLLTAVFLITVGVNAQMTIGAATAPNAASVLDLSKATTLGLYPPQVALQSITDAATITSPPTSLLIYNTATAGTSPNNVTPGYYYNAGTPAAPNWVRFFAQNNNSSSAWTTTGNSGTTASTAAIGSTVNNNFIGTTDAKDLVIASNDLERMRFTSSGSIGIGTSTPVSSALVQLRSTSQGLAFPTMTQTQRNNNIISPIGGLTIFDTTTGCLEFYVGGYWQTIGCGCTQKPATPNSIAVSPSGTICPSTSVSYSISDVSTATSYTWAYSGSVGTGGTYTGQGTTQINVTYGTSPTAGNWTVSATNACGTSNTVSTAVALTAVPSTPGTITQSPSGAVCPGQTGITYTISAVTNATSYNWTVPGTASITTNSGTSITVTWGTTAGNVTVSATGCNGTSGTSSLAVALAAVPATPGTITPSLTTYCPGTTVTYTITAVTNATTYTWTVPSGSIITSGQGTTSITVTVGSTAGNVTVTAGDCAGTSTGTSTLAINPGHGTLYYSYNGGDQTFTVPSCVTAITVKLWGAGGGAFGPFFVAGGIGGGGGCIIGVLTVTAGASLKVIVGGGGGYTGTAAYGNGTGVGTGGKGNATYETGSGGGRSAIQITSGTDAVTAGGGGGGGYNYTTGYGNGGGGGANGTYGRNTACDVLEYGALATAAAPGAGGTQTCAVGTDYGLVGSQYTGGNVSTGYNYPGGGGGGGYYGGGSGGSYYGSGGGGGSNYPAATIAGTFTLTATYTGGTAANPAGTNTYAAAGNNTDADYIAYTTATGGYIGRGGTGTYNWNPASTGDNLYYDGGNGYVEISW